MASVKVVFKSINSKTLCNDVLEYLMEGVNDFGIVWDSEPHRESYIHVVNDFLTDLAEEGKIGQFKVIGDKRNNKYTDMERGIYHVDVAYQQRNCLNTSQINLTISTFEDIDEEILDFFSLKP